MFRTWWCLRAGRKWGAWRRGTGPGQPHQRCPGAPTLEPLQARVLLDVGFERRGDYPVDPHPLGVAVGVFRTGTGMLDIATANSDGTVSVLLGDGHGNFDPAVPYPAGANPHALAVGDFN